MPREQVDANRGIGELKAAAAATAMCVGISVVVVRVVCCEEFVVGGEEQAQTGKCVPIVFVVVVVDVTGGRGVFATRCVLIVVVVVADAEGEIARLASVGLREPRADLREVQIGAHGLQQLVEVDERLGARGVLLLRRRVRAAGRTPACARNGQMPALDDQARRVLGVRHGRAWTNDHVVAVLVEHVGKAARVDKHHVDDHVQLMLLLMMMMTACRRSVHHGQQ